MNLLAALMMLAAISSIPQTALAFGKKAPVTSEKRVLMAALGDSMTVGAMADTSLPRVNAEGSLSNEPGSRSFPLEPPKNIASQDITEKDIQPYLLWDNKGSYSWATGNRVLGHSLRLAQATAEPKQEEQLVIKNLAVNGSKIADVVGQSKKLLKEFRDGKYKRVEYVTLLIGPNDVCSRVTDEGTPLEKMRNHYLEVLAHLAQIEQDRPVKVLMSTILPIYELGRPEIRNARTLFGLRCGDLRDRVLNYCNRMTGWRTDEQRLFSKDIIDRRNEMIRSVVADARELHKNKLDVHLSEIWGNVTMSKEFLALDCFHPNATAQRLISAMLWFDQPWYPHTLSPFDPSSDELAAELEAVQEAVQGSVR